MNDEPPEIDWSDYDEPKPDPEFLEEAAIDESWVDDARNPDVITSIKAPVPHGTPHAKWKLVPGSEILFGAMPPVNWLIESLDLAEGRPMGLWGAPGSGKNVLAQTWGLMVASGVSLGPWVVSAPPMRVLHITYDMGKYATSMKYRQLANGLGLDPGILQDNLDIAAHPEYNLTTDNAAGKFLKLLKDGNYGFVILDNLRAATPGSNENDSDFGTHVGNFGAACEHSGCVGLYLHHTKKGAGINLEASRGSGSILAASGPIWMIGESSKNKPRQLHHLRAHDTTTSFKDPSWVQLHLASKPAALIPMPAGHPNAAWLTITADDPTPGKKDKAKPDKRVEAILAALRATPNMGINEIREAVQMSKPVVVAVVKDMVTKGLIKNCGGNENGKAHNYIVVETSDETGSGFVESREPLGNR